MHEVHIPQTHAMKSKRAEYTFVFQIITVYMIVMTFIGHYNPYVNVICQCQCKLQLKDYLYEYILRV